MEYKHFSNMDFLSDYFENAKVLITGGCGFIGSNLIIKLLKESNCIIFNLDKMGYASDLSLIEYTINKLGDKHYDRHKLFKTDLTNPSELNSVINLSKPDYIIHLAAESHVDRSIKTPKLFIENNIIGTYNILEAVRSYYYTLESTRKKYFRFLHISTDEVFGSLGEFGSFNESTQYDPRSPYSASKAASDHLVNSWHHTYEIPVITTNCCNNYGPGQYPEKLIPKIILNALREIKIPIYGDGKNTRDWLFVEDHVNGILTVLAKGVIGEKYCIGANEEKTNNEIAGEICGILDNINAKDYSYKKLIEYVEDRSGHDKRYAIDSSKIKNKLKWEPVFTFEEGLKITIYWYLNKFMSYYKNHQDT